MNKHLTIQTKAFNRGGRGEIPSRARRKSDSPVTESGAGHEHEEGSDHQYRLGQTAHDFPDHEAHTSVLRGEFSGPIFRRPRPEETSLAMQNGKWRHFSARCRREGKCFAVSVGWFPYGPMPG